MKLLLDYAKRLERWGKIELASNSPEEARIRVRLARNNYSISAKYPSNDSLKRGYLGCIAISNLTRPGEDWHRGNDLADGPYSDETWAKILADIVGYEMGSAEKVKGKK